MAADQTLRAIITVLDRTSEPIRQINTRFAAMSSPLRQIGSRISELGELTGIKNIGEHAGAALEKVRGLGEGLLAMAGPLAALSAAGSVAGLVEIAKSTGEFAEKLDIGAAMTGIASEKLAGWHYAAGLVNIDVDRMDKGFAYLNRTISEAASGKARDAEQILKNMGFSNTPGHLVSTADALKGVAAEVKHLVDTGQIQLATEIMAKLFGARQGAQLLPLFEQGPEEINKTLKEAQEAGISLTAAQTAAGHGFMESYKAMTASVEGLKIAIGDELFPVLTPVIEAMRQWLNTNREWIATGIGDAIRDFSGWVKSVDWSSVGESLRGIAADAKWVVQELGGIGPVIAIIAGISLAPTILAFGELGGAVAAASGKFLLFPVASFVGSLATLVPAMTGLRDVWVALDIAMDANPIGAVVAAAALLAGIGYEVYEHWEKVEALFARIGKAFSWISSHISAPGGSVPGGYVDPTSGMFIPDLGAGGAAVKPPLSTLPGAAAAAGAGAAGAQGETKVTVDFKNLPPNAAVSTESRGSAAAADVNVGYAMGLGG